MLDKEPTTFEEALKILKKQEKELLKKDNEIKTLTNKLSETDHCLMIAECKITQLSNDVDDLTIVKNHFQNLFNQLNKEKYGAKTETFLKVVKSQPFLFPIQEMRIRLSDVLQKQAEEKKTKEKTNKDESKNDVSSDTHDTYEPIDFSIDSTLNDNKNCEEQFSYEVLESHFDLSEEDKKCDKCGNQMKFAYIKSRTRWVTIPARLIKQKIYYKVYECDKCPADNDNDGVSLKKSANIKDIIPGGKASPSLLAHIFGAKFINHTTYHTKSQSMAWKNMPISKQNMSQWQQAVYNKLLPLEKVLDKEITKSKYLNFDETPLKTQKCKKEEIEKEYFPNYTPRKKPDKDKEKERDIRECRIWITVGESEGHLIKSYKFRYTRSGTFVIPYLEESPNLQCIQSDAYLGYKAAIDLYNEAHPDHHIEWNICNIHARRNFVKLYDNCHSEIALQVLIIYKDIFFTDKQLRDQYHQKIISEKEFLKLREEKVLPLFSKLHTFLKPYAKKGTVYGNSDLSTAVNYFMVNYKELTAFTKYSFLTPSNNCSEIGIKQAVLIRKNSLFSGSPDGAKSGCFLLTLVQTCILNKINPVDYLRCLFEQAPYAKTEADWISLLPWNIQLTPFELQGKWLAPESAPFKLVS